MIKFKNIYFVTSMIQQIILNLFTVVLKKSESAISLRILYQHKNEALLYLLFVTSFIPHILSLLNDSTWTILSLSTLCIQCCYAISIFTDIQNYKAYKFLNNFIKLKFSQPLIFSVTNLLIEITLFIFYFYKLRTLNRNKKIILWSINMLASIGLLYFLNFNIKLICTFLSVKFACSIYYLSNKVDLDDFFDGFVAFMLIIVWVALFYIAHNAVFISNFSFQYTNKIFT
ncbi:hypothetical protein EDEG_00065 [Edhazardia aedis USNM 41457]|uniref:Uncharacterized protein n=1 Tax=Edhazardia aedis (strain USNM 41457) TaxID=1003232 RepID=J8ZZ29_EDHAE|nr:hypothetical protein EDEG_00065 [Edhazardia aedis USNM 41457]|eukprot:EJW04948.1 hypothetical protein EDEG_00065 [Edhazardia aedis USNM 41457]